MQLDQTKLHALAPLLFMALQNSQDTLYNGAQNADKAIDALQPILFNKELMARMADVRVLTAGAPTLDVLSSFDKPAAEAVAPAAEQVAPEALPAFKNITNSKQISRIAYAGSTLTVTFVNGTSYEYYEVPKTVYEQLLNADSVGTALNASIKGIYKFAKVGE